MGQAFTYQVYSYSQYISISQFSCSTFVCTPFHVCLKATHLANKYRTTMLTHILSQTKYGGFPNKITRNHHKHLSVTAHAFTKWLYACLHTVCLHKSSQVSEIKKNVFACMWVFLVTNSTRNTIKATICTFRFHNSFRKTSKVVTSVTSCYLWSLCGVTRYYLL